MPSGKIKKASASTIAEWASAVWKKNHRKTVEQSFKIFCIINAGDGTEDNILWDNSDLNCVTLCCNTAQWREVVVSHTKHTRRRDYTKTK
jgi:hypothetical protein